jgi:cell division protein FtsB
MGALTRTPHAVAVAAIIILSCCLHSVTHCLHHHCSLKTSLYTIAQDGQERQKELQERSAKRTLLEEFIRESEWGVPELEMVLERHRKALSTTAGGTVAAGAHVVDFDRWLEVCAAPYCCYCCAQRFVLFVL